MKLIFLQLYRFLPWFKGKLILGKIFFKSVINQSTSISFYAHHHVKYNIPNTKENLGVELLINGIYEKKTVHFLQRNIPNGAIFFDIGANIGSLGLPIVKAKKNIKYFGFEASPGVYEYLVKNFSENGITNFELYNKLVHKDDNQILKFYQSELYGKSSLAPTYSSEFVMVNSISLDKYCEENNISRIDWMKVDVQGFEIYVFEGMSGLLRNKKVDNILFEFESWAEDQAEVKIGVAKDFIESFGYELFNIKGKKWKDSEKGNETMIWAKPKIN
jgi:FkbM family methyltransferase